MYNEVHSYGHIHTLSSRYPRSTIPVSPSGPNPPMKHPQSLTHACIYKIQIKAQIEQIEH